MKLRSKIRQLLLLAIATLGLPGTSPAKPSYIVMPYLPTWSTGITLATIPWADINRISEAFALPNANGATPTMAAPGARASLITTAHSNSTRVHLSFGGASANLGNWSSSTDTAGHLNTFVANIMNMIGSGANSYDGVDIDWEFPNAGNGSPGETAQFTNLMTALYDALHNSANANYKGLAYDGTPKELSFYIAPGYDICGMNFNALGAVCDFASMPGYDMNAGGYNGPIGSSQTFTNCKGWTKGLNVSTLFTTLTGGGAQGFSFPASKLVLGLPFYDINSQAAVETITNGGTKVSFDTPQGESTWTKSSVTYRVTDAQSICYKMNWALANGLKGFIMWELSQAYPINGTTEVTNMWNVIGGNDPCLTLANSPTFTRTCTPNGTPTVSPTASPTRTPIPVAGRIQAEDYFGYSDSDAGNTGGVYRTDNVDIEATTDTGAGYDVGWVAAGEWLEYSIQVATTGTYNFTFRMASAQTTAMSLAMQLDGAALGSSVAIGGTTGWQTWANTVVNGLSLTAGQHTLRINMTTGGYNFNYLDISLASTPTRTVSASVTATRTASVSSTRTASLTPTLSSTLTLSPSPSASPSPTLSSTATRSASRTQTSTSTVSFSPTVSPSFTISPVASDTISPTVTRTATITRTLTASTTETRTPSQSPSMTSTASETRTATESPTHSFSPTGTPSFTASPLATDTVSPTLTRTWTSTRSPTVSPSSTRTASSTQTSTTTATVTATPTDVPIGSSPTSTFTESPTASPSATVSRTAAPSQGPPRLLEHLPYPNPCRGSLCGMAVKLEGRADELEFSLYSTAMTCVRRVKVDGSFGPGWNQVLVPVGGLGNGLYYSVVQARNGQGSSQNRQPAKLVLLP